MQARANDDAAAEEQKKSIWEVQDVRDGLEGFQIILAAMVEVRSARACNKVEALD
jgi:hypothetical protein